MGKRSARGSGGKDAFDNAGNWGDDFPQADDWVIKLFFPQDSEMLSSSKIKFCRTMKNILVH